MKVCCRATCSAATPLASSGLKTTGNAGGIHNLIVTTTGQAMSFEALLKQMGTGLLVTELMGQGVNGVTGDYSRGASGFWVEEGVLTHPVHEITIAGNLKQMYRDIVALGTDVDAARRHSHRLDPAVRDDYRGRVALSRGGTGSRRTACGGCSGSSIRSRSVRPAQHWRQASSSFALRRSTAGMSMPFCTEWPLR